MFKTIFDNQKLYFESGEIKPLKHRLQTLELLKQMMIDAEEDFLAAVNKDLNKSPQEAYLTEFLPVFKEIDYTIKNLKKWMHPTRKGGSIFAPVTSYKVLAEPKGQVLIISPWNYPLNLSLLPLVSALAAGNTVILKVAELSQHTGKALVRWINKTFASGVVFATNASPDEFEDLFDMPYGHIFFSGSPKIGREVMCQASRHLTPVTLELGGKSPAIIHPTAKLSIAAKRVAWGKWLNAGQTCIAPDYVIVEKSVKEGFVKALIEAIKEIYPDPLTGNNYSKIIDIKHFTRLETSLEGERILYGGLSNPSELKMEPTLVDEPHIDSPLMQDEIFGPILPIVTYEKTSDIYKIISHNPKPLALYVFGQDGGFNSEITGQISFGGGAINDTLVHFLSQKAPFGGTGNSGMGCYHGKYGFDAFSHFKTIATTPAWFDLSLRYPPYTDKVIKLLKKLG